VISQLLAKTKNALAAKKATKAKKAAAAKSVSEPTAPATPLEAGVAPITLPVPSPLTTEAGEPTHASGDGIHNATDLPVTQVTATAPHAPKNASMKKGGKKVNGNKNSKKSSSKRSGKMSGEKVRTHHFEELE
jgi:hypothetical protein